jgi:hypothetical protein
MTRREVIDAASQKLGRKLPQHTLSNALQTGHISRPKRYVGGWFNFEPRHVDQLVDYVQRRAHRARKHQLTPIS